MSLTTASAFARRAGPLRSIHPGALSSIGSTAVARYHQEQRRSYRFGRRYSSYIDPEIYRRLKDFGYNYFENLSWHPSWPKDRQTENAKSTWRRTTRERQSASDEDGEGARSRLNKNASPRKTPNNPEGVRPGQNIEDAERAPLEHLLFGEKKGPWSKKKGSTRKISIASDAKGDVDPVYIIDPITNRKVSKNVLTSAYATSEAGVEIPVKTSKSYRCQFAPFMPPDVEGTPVFSDGPPPEAELRKYAQDKPWESATSNSNPGGKPQELPPAGNHYGASHPTLIETLSGEHEAVQWHHHHHASSSAGFWASHPPAPKEAELNLYTAVRYNEPDGKAPAGQPALKFGDDVNKYGPVRVHEPDGKYAARQDSPADSRELDQYDAVRSHEPDGKYAAEYTEPPDQAELASYRKPFLSCEPDGRYAAEVNESQRDAAELAKYRTPFFSHEPDGKYAASCGELTQDEAELARYQAFRSHEPDGKYAANYVEVKPDKHELATYKPFRCHEPDGKYAAENSAANAEPADAGKYQAFRSHEPDGKYAAEANAVEEATEEAAEEAQDLANHEAFGYEDLDTRTSSLETPEVKIESDLEGYKATPIDEPSSATEPSPAYEKYVEAELRKYQPVRWNEPDGKPTESEVADQSTMEYDLKGNAATDTDASSQTKESGGLTGNYARDFPEEFSKTWTTESSEAIASRLPSEQNESNGAVQPALERLAQATTSESATTTSLPPNSTESTLYKILVYDPTMQSISTAETTSTVPDTSTPLTPAEVLLRISNPAKFLPHFAPLQTQGFEIVSGSGDVLIFRKVHNTPLTTSHSARAHPASSAAGASSGAAAPVNPIDMTGDRTNRDFASPTDFVVAASRFASPTGFVNYDLPVDTAAAAPAARDAGRQQQEETERPAAAAGENTTTAAAEGVTAAASTAATDETAAMGKRRGKKRSLPRKMAVGAAWLAGGAYSVGVVSEYFKTGGVDGKGPRGL